MKLHKGENVRLIGIRWLFGVLLLGVIALPLLDPGVVWAKTFPIAVERVGLYPTSLTVDSATDTVFVEGVHSAPATKWWLSAVDGATGKVVGTLDVGAYPGVLAVNPDTNTVYASDSKGLVVIDGATDKVIKVIPVRVGIWALAVNSKTNMVYFASHDGYDAYYGKANANTVLAIDGATGRVEHTFDVGDGDTNIVDIQVDADTNEIYVNDHRSIVAINGATGKVTRRIPAWSSGVEFTADPSNDTLYMTGSHSVLAVALGSQSRPSSTTAAVPFEVAGAALVVLGSGAALLYSVRHRRA
ncbi:YncE family protein [Ferrimicrobium sp.]|uniref:YncE family protein n=1 Tax=Ferrimicrobium sp. TaxID=2926050 RepID=UPI00260B5BB8|nr:YncE family protein [Ferrimicrobium sp.]